MCLGPETGTAPFQRASHRDGENVNVCISEELRPLVTWPGGGGVTGDDVSHGNQAEVKVQNLAGAGLRVFVRTENACFTSKVRTFLARPVGGGWGAGRVLCLRGSLQLYKCVCVCVLDAFSSAWSSDATLNMVNMAASSGL